MKYIDAEAIKMGKYPIIVNDFTKGWNYALDAIVENAPTADVEEVVRCKDCKWFGDIGCAIRIVDDSDRPSENDFCSFAERKDNG